MIEEGRVVDGSGNPWYNANIGVKDGRIVKVSKLPMREGGRKIKAKGFIVAPGFIDIHTHSDFCLLENQRINHKLGQGVTTEVIGLCGFSAAPVEDKFLDEFRGFASPLFGGAKIFVDWYSFSEFLDRLEKQGVGPNVASFVGHGAVRIAAMGCENRKPTEEELKRMKDHVAESIVGGAFGLSSGLMYPPGSYAETAELVELCKVASKYGGIYTTHVRSQGIRYLEAVEEAIKIGEEAAIPVVISHIQSNSRRFWGKALDVLRLIEDARSRGIDVSGDVHPYLAGSTLLTQLLPPWAYSGGVENLISKLKDSAERKKIREDMEKSTDWENYSRNLLWSDIRIAHHPNALEYEGLTLDQIARMKGIDPYEALFDLLIESRCEATIVLFMCAEEEKVYAMKHPLTMIESDCFAAYPNKGKPHPRAYGTFPIVLGHYTRQRRIMPLEEAVRKMTSLPAQRLGCHDRGLIAKGMSADIVIFDEEKIEDKATYSKPHQYPEGIRFVIVNGEVVLDEGALTEALPGKVLRHEASSS